MIQNFPNQSLYATKCSVSIHRENALLNNHLRFKPTTSSTPQGTNKDHTQLRNIVEPKPNIPRIEVVSIHVHTEVAKSRQQSENHCLPTITLHRNHRKDRVHLKGLDRFSIEKTNATMRDTSHLHIPSLTTQKKKGKFDLRTLIQTYFQA